MDFLDKMERKIGKHPIENLMRYVVICYIVGYILYYAFPDALSYLTLEPYYILHGQIWRIVSWILVPPSTSIIWAVIMVFFYYQLGTNLEHVWGAFKFNVFFFGGMIWTVIGAFILYFAFLVRTGTPYLLNSVGSSSMISTYYMCMSIFIAFALMFPDQKVMLYFIIPIRMKWLAVFYVVITIYEAVVSYWPARISIIMALVNFVLFYLAMNKGRGPNPKNYKRKHDFKRKTSQQFGYTGSGKQYGPAGKAKGPGHRSAGPSGRSAGSAGRSTSRGGAGGPTVKVSRHKCAVCGQTELDNPNLEFRYCSKCNGNYEYCQNHLWSHKHIL